MGPIPRKSFIVEPEPLSLGSRLVHLGSRLVRMLPAPLVRAVLLTDIVLCVLPFWGRWAYRRWSGVWLSGAEFRRVYRQGIRFVAGHLAHTNEGTGLGMVEWTARPIRSAPVRERSDYRTPGSCGTCRNCCTTHWLPEAQRAECPFLGKDGCRVYGGLWWDYYNCGRYPARARDVRAYDCPRFEGPVEIPDALPADFPLVPAAPEEVYAGGR